MGISLTHPQRQSRQHAYSDRDIAYLEKNGWVREQLAHSIVREATTEGSLAGSRKEDGPTLAQQIEADVYASGIAAAPPKKNKGGRPRKTP